MNDTIHNPQNTFAITLFLAMAVHAALIFGVTFDFNRGIKEIANRDLTITVIRNPNKPTKNKKADYAAQISQDAAGNIHKKHLPKTQIAPPAVKPATKTTRKTSGNTSKNKERTKKAVKVSRSKKQTRKKRRKTKNAERNFDPSEFLERTSQEILRLTAEYDIKREAYAKRPKQAYISASTQEIRYASYLKAWAQKVERIGTLNFPLAAKKRRMFGAIRLTVKLLKNGTIKSISIEKSSGFDAIDKGAIDIIRLGQPYARFPKDIAKEIDILNITRTFLFTPDLSVSSK